MPQPIGGAAFFMMIFKIPISPLLLTIFFYLIIGSEDYFSFPVLYILTNLLGVFFIIIFFYCTLGFFFPHPPLSGTLLGPEPFLICYKIWFFAEVQKMVPLGCQYLAQVPMHRT